MRHWKSTVLLAACIATMAEGQQPLPECRTYYCGGEVICQETLFCSDGCQMILVSTPYGMGATCDCADLAGKEDECCDLVIVPGDGGEELRAIGHCWWDFWGPCDLFIIPCHVDYSMAAYGLAITANCVPPIPPPK